MKGVPGVMQLESKWLSFAFSGGSHRPFASSSSKEELYIHKSDSPLSFLFCSPTAESKFKKS
jgi:hypothetical protein